MRKIIPMLFLCGLPAMTQVTGGHETVQDAIRFERQKEAAAARQARIETTRDAKSTADRQDYSGKAARTSKTKKGSAERNKTSRQ